MIQFYHKWPIIVFPEYLNFPLVIQVKLLTIFSLFGLILVVSLLYNNCYLLIIIQEFIFRISKRLVRGVSQSWTCSPNRIRSIGYQQKHMALAECGWDTEDWRRWLGGWRWTVDLSYGGEGVHWGGVKMGLVMARCGDHDGDLRRRF